MWIYHLFLTVAAAALAVALYFFGVGLADGSVSSFNMVMWLALLAGLGGIVFSGVAIDRSGKRAAAIAVLAIVAVPALLAALFFLVLIVTQPHWN
ncbi:MAG: hypothetical protein WBA48_15800 [Xanthobacteraceae bacterium]